MRLLRLIVSFENSESSPLAPSSSASKLTSFAGRPAAHCGPRLLVLLTVKENKQDKKYHLKLKFISFHWLGLGSMLIPGNKSEDNSI